MKKLAMTLLPAMALAFLAAHPATNGWEQMNLKGRVRTVTVTTGVEEFQDIETISFDDEGNYRHILIRDLNHVFADSEVSYAYDEAGRLLSISRPTNEDRQIENFLYDPEGRLFLVTKSWEGAGMLFTERTFWDLAGKKTLTTIHEWNDLVWVESYSHNAQGFITQSLRPASPYSRLGFSIHSYDDKGNPLLVRETEIETEVSIQSRYEYTYDDTGNILSALKYVDYGEGEVLEEITGYEYEYYPAE